MPARIFDRFIEQPFAELPGASVKRAVFNLLEACCQPSSPWRATVHGHRKSDLVNSGLCAPPGGCGISRVRYNPCHRCANRALGDRFVHRLTQRGRIETESSLHACLSGSDGRDGLLRGATRTDHYLTCLAARALSPARSSNWAPDF